MRAEIIRKKMQKTVLNQGVQIKVQPILTSTSQHYLFFPTLGVVQTLVFQARLMSLYLHHIAFDFLYMIEFSCDRI